MKKHLSLTGFILILTAAVAMAEARTWTQAKTGKTLEGELNGVQGDKAQVVLGNGTAVEIPIAMLTEEDKTYIEEWQKKMADGDTPSDGEPAAEAGASAEKPEGPVELTLTGVHLCCGGCKDAAEDSLGSLTGVTIDAGNDIVIKADDADLAKAAFDSLVKKGFVGTPSHAWFALAPVRESAATVESSEFRNVHICCNKCVRAIEDVLDDVEGVEDYEVDKGSSFTVTGKFKPSDVVKGLREAGMSARPYNG